VWHRPTRSAVCALGVICRVRPKPPARDPLATCRFAGGRGVIKAGGIGQSPDRPLPLPLPRKREDIGWSLENGAKGSPRSLFLSPITLILDHLPLSFLAKPQFADHDSFAVWGRGAGEVGRFSGSLPSPNLPLPSRPLLKSDRVIIIIIMIDWAGPIYIYFGGRDAWIDGGGQGSRGLPSVGR
jgi:hypothetical protein